MRVRAEGEGRVQNSHGVRCTLALWLYVCAWCTCDSHVCVAAQVEAALAYVLSQALAHNVVRLMMLVKNGFA